MGVAKGYSQLPVFLSTEDTMYLLKEVIPGGLSDKNSDVRLTMIEAAQEAIAQHGEVGVVIARLLIIIMIACFCYFLCSQYQQN